MQDIGREWGGLDILVNNAGILRDRSIGKMTIEEWQSVIDVNLSGVFYSCKFGLEVLRDGGSIVSVGSLAAKMGFHGQSNYAAAKAGVQALTRVLARECAKRSIRVNAVAPGVIDTPMVAQITDAARGQLTRSIALHRMGRPQDVAEAVLFLCSPLAGYITGMCSRLTAASWAERHKVWCRPTERPRVDSQPEGRYNRTTKASPGWKACPDRRISMAENVPSDGAGKQARAGDRGRRSAVPGRPRRQAGETGPEFHAPRRRGRGLRPGRTPQAPSPSPSAAPGPGPAPPDRAKPRPERPSSDRGKTRRTLSRKSGPDRPNGGRTC